MAKRLARWWPGYSLDENTFFDCDGAPETVRTLRQKAFFELAQTLQQRHPLHRAQMHLVAQHGETEPLVAARQMRYIHVATCRDMVSHPHPPAPSSSDGLIKPLLDPPRRAVEPARQLSWPADRLRADEADVNNFRADGRS